MLHWLVGSVSHGAGVRVVRGVAEKEIEKTSCGTPTVKV